MNFTLEIYNINKQVYFRILEGILEIRCENVIVVNLR